MNWATYWTIIAQVAIAAVLLGFPLGIFCYSILTFFKNKKDRWED